MQTSGDRTRWLADAARKDKKAMESAKQDIKGLIGMDKADGIVDDATRDEELQSRFVTFSKGPRSCIGREIALRMIERAVRDLLERWEILAKGDLNGRSWLEMRYDECWVELRGR